ncbi:MAG TPA: glycoside hydrolase family 68 protein [Ilumatobacteraceae bacterium]|nr:glycoside hydrolase family 68 protein [Ilumatobacteraceae bacterium]
MTTDSASGDIVTGFAGSWLPEDLDGLEVTESNAIPVIDASLADERVTPDHWVWDWWPVRDRDGDVADFDGWNIAIALSAPADVLPGKRHDIATHRYLLSDDGGRTWTDGGDLFPDEGLLGTRQWAGSAMFDDETDTLYAFYTATGDEADGQNMPETTTDDETSATTTDTTDDETDTTDEQTAPSGGTVGDEISYRQRLALATATLTVSNGEVEFADWSDHDVLVTGDDTDLYASTEATEGGAGEIDAFRDPWYFLDEETGEEYLLFTATMPQAECDGDGVVGIARAMDDDLREWELLPPMLDGHCVNSELERPQMMVEDGFNYLLFTTHSHTFQDDASGPEGMYGFVADSFLGTYEPLNGTGLVLANPDEAPYQSYSWMTLSNGVVTSFFQFFGIDGDVEVSYIGEQSPEFQMEHFGGTFAPSILVDFDGDRTEIVEELAPGQLVP